MRAAAACLAAELHVPEDWLRLCELVPVFREHPRRGRRQRRSRAMVFRGRHMDRTIDAQSGAFVEHADSEAVTVRAARSELAWVRRVLKSAT